MRDDYLHLFGEAMSARCPHCGIREDRLKLRSQVPADGASAGTYFVDGDISAAGTDVDYYTMSVPSGTTEASLFCSAARAGRS